MPELYMVFDVESKGLHGEGFSVGWVVVDAETSAPNPLTELDQGYLSTRLGIVRGWGTHEQRQSADDWLQRHIAEGEPQCISPQILRKDFLARWLYWKSLGAELVADCAWPVEARFLADVVDDHPSEREYAGPLPLHELATARLLAGLDPVASCPRLSTELPVHFPLADARQSARLWLEALKEIRNHARSESNS